MSKKKERTSWFYNPADGMRGGKYVIFREAVPEGTWHNPYARAEKSFTAEQAQSGVYQAEKTELINMLKSLAAREAVKETAYMAKKLAQLKLRATQGGVVRTPKFISQLDSIITSASPGYISAFFTMVLNTNQQLKRIISKTGDKGGETKDLKESVFDRKFSEYFEGKLKEIIAATDRDDSAKNLNITMESIVSGYVDKVFKDIGVTKGVVTDIRNEYERKIFNQLTEQEKAIVPPEWFKDLAPITAEGVNTFISNNTKVVKKNSEGQISINTAVRRLAKATAQVIAGKSLEVTIEATGAKMFGGGNSANPGGRAADLDNIILDRLGSSAIEASFNLGQYIDEQMASGKGTGHAKMERMMEALSLELSETSAAILAISAKDYGSNYDFSVKGGSDFTFNSVNKRMGEMAGAVGQSFDVNEFAFILNNTIRGAFLDNARQYVLDSIGYVAAAFMFDDVRQMFSSNLGGNVIRLYNIGGTYFTLSDILNRTILAMSDLTATNLVSVSANWADDAVSSMGGVYEESRGRSFSNREALMTELAGRWKKVRAEARASTVSIKMKYSVMKAAASSMKGLMRG